MTKKVQIIDLVQKGLSNLEIADAIGVSANWTRQIRAIIKPYDGTYPRPFTKTKLACEFMRANPELSVIEVSRALGLKRSICQHAKDKYLRRDSCNSAKLE